MRAWSLNRKEFEFQRVMCKLTRSTSRTEIKFLCRTTTWCTTQFQKWKAVAIPAANVASDKNWDTWRTKHVSFISMVINATTLLVDWTLLQLKNTGHTRIKCHIHCRNHVDHAPSAAQYRIVFHFKTFEHSWKSRSFILYNIGMKMKTLPELWFLHDTSLDSEEEGWLEHTLAPKVSENKNTTFVRKAHRVQKFKLGNALLVWTSRFIRKHWIFGELFEQKKDSVHYELKLFRCELKLSLISTCCKLKTRSLWVVIRCELKLRQVRHMFRNDLKMRSSWKRSRREVNIKSCKNVPIRTHCTQSCTTSDQNS